MSQRIGCPDDPRGEDGAAQAIGLLATLPAVLLVVGLFFESVFILEAGMAVHHAARVAARSALVWESEGADVATLKAHQAAALALTPVASARAWHRPSRVGAETARDAAALVEVLGRSFPQRYRDSAIAAKYIQAREATTVKVVERMEDGRRMIGVELEYEYPFSFGFLGRIAGRRPRAGGRGFVRPIVVESMRPAQEVVPDGLDISYHPAP